MLTSSQRDEALMLQISRGDMPRLEENPPILGLMAFESKLRKAMTCHTIHNLLDNISMSGTYKDLNYWNDWAKILASHRLKKIGFTREANNMLRLTSYAGYQIGK